MKRTEEKILAKMKIIEIMIKKHIFDEKMTKKDFLMYFF